MTGHEYNPLNYGELMNLADLYVSADPDENYEAGVDTLRRGITGLIPIYDAESELVCLVPVDKADLMVRLINTYKWHNEHEPL